MRARQYTVGRTFITLAKACFAGDWNFFSCPNLRVQKRRVRPFWRGSGRKFNRVESRTSYQPSYDINCPRIYPPVRSFNVCRRRLFTEKFRNNFFFHLSFSFSAEHFHSLQYFLFISWRLFVLLKRRCNALYAGGCCVSKLFKTIIKRIIYVLIK